MATKKELKAEIADLRERVARAEGEIAALRAQQPPRINIQPPATEPFPRQWWQSPWTCQSDVQVIKTDPSVQTFAWN